MKGDLVLMRCGPCKRGECLHWLWKTSTADWHCAYYAWQNWPRATKAGPVDSAAHNMTLMPHLHVRQQLLACSFSVFVFGEERGVPLNSSWCWGLRTVVTENGWTSENLIGRSPTNQETGGSVPDCFSLPNPEWMYVEHHMHSWKCECVCVCVS